VTDPLFAAVDLGGTNVSAIVADFQGRVLGEDIRPSQATAGFDATLAAMLHSLSAAIERASVERGALHGLGVASPGAVDTSRGVVTGAPQLAGWKDVPLVEILQERLGISVRIENDASAAALGEHTFGAGRGTRHMIFLTISTGLGGGIIIDGKLYTGSRGFAGEIGHAIIDFNGKDCSFCGRGCLESLASGAAIARRAVAAIADGGAPLLARLVVDAPVTAELVADAARQGDEACRRIYRETGGYLGVTLANCVNIFNPEAIILGGGVTLAADLFLEDTRKAMAEMAIREPLKDVRLALGELGDLAGCLGMIALMRDRPTP